MSRQDEKTSAENLIQNDEEDKSAMEIKDNRTETYSQNSPKNLEEEEEVPAEGKSNARPKTPEEKCVICLGEPQNLSFTDTCQKHKFCFVCILEWSKIKAECP